MRKIFFIIPLAVLVLAGCSRPEGAASALRIRIPEASSFQVSGKAAAQAVVDYSKLCFYANVKGPGIPSSARACQVEKGLFAGGAAPGETITVDGVPAGTDRVIEVYGYRRSSTSEICPAAANEIAGPLLARFYLLGSQGGIEIKDAETNVAITVGLPDESKNVVAQNGWAASCFGTAAVAPTGRVLTGGQAQTGARFALRSQVSEFKGHVQSGSKFMLKSRVRDQ